jgi:hypothetical protein
MRTQEQYNEDLNYLLDLITTVAQDHYLPVRIILADLGILNTDREGER